MYIDSSLFHANQTTYWTPLRLQFHLLLRKCAAWDGLIPLSQKQMSQKLSCGRDTIRRFISSCLHEKILIKKDGELYFQKFVEFNSDESGQASYVQHLALFHSSEFKKLNIRVQRFILEFIRRGTHQKNGRNVPVKLQSLYNRYGRSKEGKVLIKRGLFNVESKKEMLKIIDEAKLFFEIEVYRNQENETFVWVKKLKKEWEQECTLVPNEGKHLYIEKKLDRYGIVKQLINKESIQNLVNIFESYYKELGLEKTSKIFDRALRAAVNGFRFQILLLKGKDEEVRKYFYHLMREKEKEYAEQLTLQLFNLEKTESNVKKDRVLNVFKEQIGTSIQRLKSSLSLIEQRWKKQLLHTVNQKGLHISRKQDPIIDFLFSLETSRFNILQRMNELSEITFNIKFGNSPGFLVYNWLEE